MNPVSPTTPQRVSCGAIYSQTAPVGSLLLLSLRDLPPHVSIYERSLFYALPFHLRW
jgi:hypothetical protein